MYSRSGVLSEWTAKILNHYGRLRWRDNEDT
jgi:hypothetical protein